MGKTRWPSLVDGRSSLRSIRHFTDEKIPVVFSGVPPGPADHLWLAFLFKHHARAAARRLPAGKSGDSGQPSLPYPATSFRISGRILQSSYLESVLLFRRRWRGLFA